MRFTHSFIDRPILATVISVFVTLIGLGALITLPVAHIRRSCRRPCR
jgi:HAE1 family hydrophobic/amphiphilic exporter-1